MRTLYVAWQDPEIRSWLPVGKLTADNHGYTFVYTKGAHHSPRFVPFGRMNDIYRVYRSADLFPLFQNRTLPKNRPEYSDYIRWLGLDVGAEFNPIEMLGRSGGLRATDSLVVFPSPQKTEDSMYHQTFFAHGVQHLAEEAVKAIELLEPNTKLYPMLDNLNSNDVKAVALRTENPVRVVGYIPRFLAQDIRDLMAKTLAKDFDMSVEKSNPDAPTQMKLLCSISVPWPEEFEPFSDDLFRPLSLEDSNSPKTAVGF